MDDLPVELVHAIATYVGWKGYAALRASSHWMHACLPWHNVLVHASTRTVPIRTLPWNQDWFARHVPADTTVKGTWALDGFHGIVFLYANQNRIGESVCSRGLLEGDVVLHSPWRGGMSLTQTFRAGILHQGVASAKGNKERPDDLSKDTTQDGHRYHNEPL
jgi:hypothetical protein